MSTFRLAGLLNLRQMEEDRAAAALAHASTAHRHANEARQTTQGTLGAATFPTHASTPHWHATVATRVAASILLRERTDAVARAEIGVVEAQQAWKGARARAVALTKLKERHDETVRIEEGRAEQIALDEIASRMSTKTSTEVQP